MSGISMQNSSRRLGEFTAVVAQVSEEVKYLCEQCPKENTPISILES